jgi:hypothetical protein
VHVSGTTDPEITLLRGPTEGEVILVWRGRVLRINLADKTYCATVIRVATLLARPANDALDRPTILSVAELQGNSAVDFLVSAIGRRSAESLLVFDSADVPIGRALGRFAKVIAIPSTLRDASNRAMVSTIAAAMMNADANSIALFGGGEIVPLVMGLLQATSLPSIELYIRPGIAWRSGGWEAIRMLASAARRFEGRLHLHSPAGAVREALAVLKVTAQHFVLHLPRPEVFPAAGRPALVFGPAPSEVPTAGHLAAAAVAAIKRGTEVGAVYVPDWEIQTHLLLEAYGLGSKMRIYRDSCELVSSLAGERFVYLSPFPNGTVSGAVLLAIEVGGLPLVAAGCMEFPDTHLQAALSATFWEDGEILADHIMQIVSRYSELISRLGVGIEPVLTDA